MRKQTNQEATILKMFGKLIPELITDIDLSEANAVRFTYAEKTYRCGMFSVDVVDGSCLVSNEDAFKMDQVLNGKLK